MRTVISPTELRDFEENDITTGFVSVSPDPLEKFWKEYGPVVLLGGVLIVIVSIV